MRLLDSLGWKDNGSGIRVKNGQQLAFTIITPAVSKSRERCATLLQAQLKKVGAQVTIQSVEVNTFIRLESTHDFDAAMHLWHLDASPASIPQVWGGAAATDANGLNYGSYISVSFDATVDSAIAASSLEQATPLYKRAYQIIVDDAPAIWLYEPRTVVALQRRIQPATMRADAWWANVADWRIPAGERIARDRIPVTTTP
jgi:peptide/nickel transport system substrate-binding protein